MMRAVILPTHNQSLFDQAVREAAQLLRAGEVVAIPTETVYGLAANALDAVAVGRIFDVKGRPAHNPLIVHVADQAMARRCVTQWPGVADRLASSFWPGPLTLVLPKDPVIPSIVTAGGSTVGVRWPSHPFAQALIRACGFPLAAPSANLSNQVSPTNAAHVQKVLGDRIRLIVDGGASHVGIESTVVDISVSPARLLRPGMIHAESLLAAMNEQVLGGNPPDGQLRSPGLLPKHYAPRARLILSQWKDEADLAEQIAASNAPRSAVQIIAHRRIPLTLDVGGVSVIPHDAEAFARAIYAELHRCDEAGAALIIMENLPETPEWLALRDRLKRAAS